MARSQIVNTSEDLQTDTGAALFSLVQGEQFEYAVTLAFLENAALGYGFECAVMEGLNVSGQTEPPLVAKPAGQTDQLTVFVPVWKNTWNPATAYDRDDLVKYAGAYYIKLVGTGVVDATTPDASPNWAVTQANKVYIQFPASLSDDWAVQPNTASNVYGFIELSVTEPIGGRYQRTWKPLRGRVEFLYSPTKLVT